mmetsp:Transcript_29458/g.62538  ORF Transcript_29458/g.62538 Transcript_29458/m.62538 type:complete len:357 (-) Transcript_29458:232-1302(-)|eukprot:CAMPEP_0172321168 /NCGR_PEP_ID=MMETSP1058-20130122/42539_1 /TAXON_ID=83371 /ORGANISM="Detonula confervacea, Strain CCMP 353" /LENGTH=356 /DNA_ID=CAMNT_0013036601 /DNA_START=63 /DNA_END=1133 /DNA_ORIENTATION=-
MRVCLWLLVIIQLVLLPLLGAQSLRGAEDGDRNAGGNVSADAALEADMEEATYVEDLDDLQRRTSSQGVSLAANNTTEMAVIDQFHRDERASNAHIYQTRIIGGSDAVNDQQSYTVSLQDRHGNHYCGGSLVSKDCILTAAHCSNAVTQKGPITVVIGRNVLSQQEGGERLKVRYEMIHPKYNVLRANIEWKYDFAVMCLNRPTMTRAKVIKLNRDNSVPRAGSQVKVSGWGDTNPDETVRQQSDTLQVATLRMVSNNQCNAITGTYGSYSVSYQGYIEEDMMCARNRRRDSCQGDSGGPMVHQGRLVGVTSWGVGCNNRSFPGVYARVSSGYSWIQKKICEKSMYPDPSFQCEKW